MSEYTCHFPTRKKISGFNARANHDLIIELFEAESIYKQPRTESSSRNKKRNKKLNFKAKL